MGELPPADDMPRISSSVCPGPLERIDTPGTVCIRSVRSGMPRSWMSSPEIAVMLIAVCCTVEARLVAVTMTSSSRSIDSTRAWSARDAVAGPSASSMAAKGPNRNLAGGVSFGIDKGFSSGWRAIHARP